MQVQSLKSQKIIHPGFEGSVHCTTSRVPEHKYQTFLQSLDGKTKWMLGIS
jgi:hypothetical protein